MSTPADPAMLFVGLVAKNSADYVLRFARLTTSGRIVVPLRSRHDETRIRALNLVEIEEPAEGGGWVTAGATQWPNDDRIAQVAFTSGTEGEPKAIVLTHANLASTVRRLQEAMGVDATLREYVGVPVYHSFGFARCRLAMTVGGSAWIPSAGFSTVELARMLTAGEVNAVSAVPSLWRLILKNPQPFLTCGLAVRWIEIGSQPMSADEKASLRRVFPNAVILQHYGLTEASRSTFLRVDSATEDALDTVGAPTGDVEVQLDREGRVQIRGSNVAKGLLRDGRIDPITDNQGWFTTQDLGELSGGRLRFLGRADDIMNLGGMKVAPESVEHRMRELLGPLEGLAVVRISDSRRGDGLLVAAPHSLAIPDQILSQSAAQSLATLGVQSGQMIPVLRMAVLPVTDAGKPKRKQIAELFAATAPRPLDPPRARAPDQVFLQPDESSRLLALQRLFADCLGRTSVTPDSSYVSLGGDSLSYVELSAGLENLLGELPPNWEERTIAELAAHRSPARVWRSVDITVLLRFISIVCIVVGHFSSLPVGGSTFLLLVVAGFNFSRFQLPSVLEKDSLAPIWPMMLKILMPTLLVVVLLQLKKGEVHWPSLLLINNLFNTNIAAVDFWFLEILLQVMLIAAALLWLPPVRVALRANPWATACGLFMISLLVREISDRLLPATSVFERVPNELIWLFFLGWVLREARSNRSRLVAAALACCAPFIVWPAWHDHFYLGNAPIWVATGSMLLVLSRKPVPLPRGVDALVVQVAAASMFIYLTHYTVSNWIHRAIPGWQNAAVETVVAIAFGVLASKAWGMGIRTLDRFRRSRRPTALEDSLI